jgi:hypothetical protein
MVTALPTSTGFGANVMPVTLGLAAKKQNLFVTYENNQIVAFVCE